jgi:hypothetical protein
VLVVIVLPCLLFLGLSAWFKLRAARQPAKAIAPGVLAAVEALDETDEVDL